MHVNESLSTFLALFSQEVIPQQSKISINLIENISYSIEIEDKEKPSSLPCQKKFVQKKLLDNVSGIFKAGEVTAIMGASGAGKTTLLNVLACKVPKQNL